MKPLSLTDAELAFPAEVLQLMPPYAAIPQEYKRGHNRWCQLQSDWFFCGIQRTSVTPKPGIDPEQAWRHLSAIQRSFAPKHEHKAAAVAYLLNEWFEDVQYIKLKETL